MEENNVIKRRSLNTSLNMNDLSRIEFFTAYVRMLNATIHHTQRLAPREVEMMGYILAQPIHHVQFRGTAFRRMLKYFNIQAPTARTYRRHMKQKGWLTNKSVPNSQLINLQGMVQGNNVTEINFNLKLVSKEDTKYRKQQLNEAVNLGVDG